jgi:hypothetical protein
MLSGRAARKDGSTPSGRLLSSYAPPLLGPAPPLLPATAGAGAEEEEEAMAGAELVPLVAGAEDSAACSIALTSAASASGLV